jgi:hypothetical protein
MVAGGTWGMAEPYGAMAKRHELRYLLRRLAIIPVFRHPGLFLHRRRVSATHHPFQAWLSPHRPTMRETSMGSSEGKQIEAWNIFSNNFATSVGSASLGLGSSMTITRSWGPGTILW